MGSRTGGFFAAVLALMPFVAPAPASAGDGQYLFDDKQRMQIVVNILGEVKQPGEYTLPDGSDVLELISHAGGATEYGNLGHVSLRRRALAPLVAQVGAGAPPPKEGEKIEVDINSYLDDPKSAELPLLQPGDVVTVSRNRTYGWRTFFGMARDVAVVASAYFLYDRSR